MRPLIAGLMIGLLLVCIPASADFEDVTVGSNLDSVDSGPLTVWASYGPGVAWGDYDQDGDLDVFLTARFDHLGQETAEQLGYQQISQIPANHSDEDALLATSTGQSHLMQNQGDGTFIDVSDEVGVGSQNVTTLGATWVDFDGDGDVDLYLSNYGRANLLNPIGSGETNQMFQNQNGTFNDVTTETRLGNPGHSSGSVWADYDNDGDMDCYSLNFGMVDEYTGQARRETNILYRDDGDSNGDGIPEFNDQTGEAGVYGQSESSLSDFETLIGPSLQISTTAPVNPSTQVSLPPGISNSPSGSGMSWAAVWVDVDGDGWQDLYVASDFGISPLYHNNHDGTFDLVTVEMSMDIRGTGMGTHAADIDLDGDLDVCQSNFGPNYLWMNQGDSFSENSEGFGINTNILVNWDCHFFDYDLDGDMDLWFGVGRINQYISNQFNSLYRNDGDLDGDGHLDFIDVAAELGISGTNKTMGTALADYDNDGDLDILMAHSDRPVILWRNTAVEDGSGGWLKVRLHGVEQGSNSHGIGCVVKVYLEDGTMLMQQAYAGDGFLGSSDPSVHFGLGQQTIDHVEVTWSTGHTQTIGEVQVDSVLNISEELPPAVADYSSYILGILSLGIILLLWPQFQRNS
ncbi:MAG: CRTAC1 family protein [Candidatus Thalassarchaeaceae archaeon]|nr:CRTAC1 family protein [Candidatus Thalassarchaeaceae archaeon]